ncbi:MAG: hypothetical protein K2Q10_10210 [Rhodospirillales bacterium]|nr:hypothetical protein [Rhodospirillales bacterium]
MLQESIYARAAALPMQGLRLPKRKSEKIWIWKAFCRDTEQLIDWECGARDPASLGRLLERPGKWNVRLFCADDYAPYEGTLNRAGFVGDSTS